jgi:hypothetical protein
VQQTDTEMPPTALGLPSPSVKKSHDIREFIYGMNPSAASTGNLFHVDEDKQQARVPLGTFW